MFLWFNETNGVKCTLLMLIQARDWNLAIVRVIELKFKGAKEQFKELKAKWRAEDLSGR